jgi:hypothetical protein
VLVLLLLRFELLSQRRLVDGGSGNSNDCSASKAGSREATTVLEVGRLSASAGAHGIGIGLLGERRGNGSSNRALVIVGVVQEVNRRLAALAPECKLRLE